MRTYIIWWESWYAHTGPVKQKAEDARQAAKLVSRRVRGESSPVSVKLVEVELTGEVVDPELWR